MLVHTVLLFFRNVASLPKEDRIAKLSKDASHCCLKVNENVPPIVLPRKSILSRVPLSLIAFAHQVAVRNQPDQRIPQNIFIGATSRAMNNSNQPNQRNSQNILNGTSQAMNISNFNTNTKPQIVGVQVPNKSFGVPQSRMLPHKVGFQTPNSKFRMIQPMHNGSALNRPSPYPVRLSTTSPLAMHAYSPRNQFRGVGSFQPKRDISKQSQTVVHEEIHVIDLIEDTPPKQPVLVPQVTSHDVSWLEKGIREIKASLLPITIMLDHFPVSKANLQEDFGMLTSYSDRLTHNIKIAICNLAKTNQDIMDANKSAVDTKVSNIVRDQIDNLTSKSITLKKIDHSVEINITKPNTPQDKTPETVTTEKLRMLANPTQSIEEGLNPALLCETVLQEGNKENKNSNKPVTTPVKTKKKGRPRSFVKISSKTVVSCKVGSQAQIPVIILDDEEERDDNSKYRDFCLKYDIKPCRIVLQRIKTP